ncbi:MAG: 50S ribosomal protein L22 [Nanoarchaeota archaeon]|nr:50S ribosomal protein L22 [Nanoarchaeota archaeon]|tara:strand:+ start:122 stop:616 length:495 start_codon:yes stop_codon:yes gene_type:complete
MVKETATAYGRGLPISTKQGVEICNFIRGRTVAESKKLLEGVIAGRTAVPFKRFNKDMGHRKGKIASGRFPKKASEHILNLIKSVESNAKSLGLNASLIIEELIANKGSRNWHYGRIRRIKNKRTHVKITVKEGKVEKKTQEKPKKKPEVKKEKPKEKKNEEKK